MTTAHLAIRVRANSYRCTPTRENIVFLTIAVVLLVLWALGFFVFAVVGGLVHLLLVIAVLAIIWHFVKGGRARV